MKFAVKIGHWGAAALTAGVLLGAAGASVHGYHVLYSFCTLASCTDGSGPDGLVEDSAGNFYGTVYQGGAHGFGGIFELKRGKQNHYKYDLLYSFCPQQNCVDGGYPTGGLILDTNGNLYGSALIGGSQGNGEVFELKHGHKGWSLDVLYGFCPQAINCTDGVGPDSGLAYAGQQSGVPYDGASPLFGTTDGGGITGIWQGVAYEVQPGKNGWSETVVYDFCERRNCTDGAYPFATLLEDSAGNLWGTTLEGGTSNDGTAFELANSNGSWSETVLYSFCSLAGCADGAYPHGGLVLDPSGHLDGATLNGGMACTIDNLGCGIAYTIVPNGTGSQESVQHTFCTRKKCPDGAEPEGVAAMGSSGDFFATAQTGGDRSNMTAGGGTLYELSGSTFTTLYKFCRESSCTDGATPTAGPVRDAGGALFGTASAGGAHGGGVVYEYNK